jgi:hypothetical protein
MLGGLTPDESYLLHTLIQAINDRRRMMFDSMPAAGSAEHIPPMDLCLHRLADKLADMAMEEE